MAKSCSSGFHSGSILDKVPEPTVRGRYLHWDKLRHLTPPEGLTHLDWWFALKIRRKGSKLIPLEDKSGTHFRFNLVDPLPECMHHLDSLAHGVIQPPDPVTNPGNERSLSSVLLLIEGRVDHIKPTGRCIHDERSREKMIREGRAPRDRGERMIFNNYRTMQHILEIKDKNLSRDLLCEIHSVVTDGTLIDPSGAGRFRRPDEAVVVGDDLGEAFDVPPPAKELDRRVEKCARSQTVKRPANSFTPW